MTNNMIIDLGKIVKMLLKRAWVFIIVLFVFVGGGYAVAENTNSNEFNYIADGEILVTQDSSKEAGKFLDSASIVQPTYDSTEILLSNKFLERVEKKVNFEVTLAELKACITVERLTTTRVLNIRVIRGNQDESREILTSFLEESQSYMEEIMPGVQVEILELEGSLTVRQEQSSVNGVKRSILMGIAINILLVALFVVLYLVNDSVRYEDDVERYLGEPLMGTISNVKYSKERK